MSDKDKTNTEGQPVKQAKETKPSNGETAPPKVEVMTIKHEFDSSERQQIGGDLARTIGSLRGIQSEFDQVKASYKAKITEAESNMNRLSTDLVNGFEMREQRCVVVFRPRDRKKDFIAEEDWNDFGKEALPALTEDMTQADFQTDLLQAESTFDRRCEITLFPRTANDFGLMIVGTLKGRWYSALRVTIGRHMLNQRLDSEQPSDKSRWGAIKRQALWLETWMLEELGKEAAKGFKEPIEKALNEQKEKVE